MCCCVSKSVSIFKVKQYFQQFPLLHGNKRPTRCNRLVFYCKTYCSINMFQAPLCPSSGARELYRWLLPMVLGALVYRSVVWCGAWVICLQVIGLVWSCGLYVYRLLVWCGAVGSVSGSWDAAPAASRKPDT